MGCVVAVIGMGLPRLAILASWLNDPALWGSTFSSQLWPVLGFVFLPWTTLAWALVYAPIKGVTGFGWVIVAFAFFADISVHVGSAKARRQRDAAAA